MSQWFTCKVKYDKTMQDGGLKPVNEPYLVEAINFTEAERRIIEEMKPYLSGEFDVTNIAKAHYAELFETVDDSADRWFRVKLSFITLDEKSGKEKKQSHNVLVQASDLRDAIKRLDEGMKGSMMDYTISAVTETPLVDVYHYTADIPEKAEK